jgi:hypothetical protein
MRSTRRSYGGTKKSLRLAGEHLGVVGDGWSSDTFSETPGDPTVDPARSGTIDAINEMFSRESEYGGCFKAEKTPVVQVSRSAVEVRKETLTALGGNHDRGIGVSLRPPTVGEGDANLWGEIGVTGADRSGRARKVAPYVMSSDKPQLVVLSGEQHHEGDCVENRNPSDTQRDRGSGGRFIQPGGGSGRLDSSGIGETTTQGQTGGLFCRESSKPVSRFRVWKSRKKNPAMTLGRDIGFEAVSFYALHGLVGKFSY